MTGVLEVAAQVEEELGGGMTAGGQTGDRQLGVGQRQAELEAVRSTWKREYANVRLKVSFTFTDPSRLYVFQVCVTIVNQKNPLVGWNKLWARMRILTGSKKR